MKKLGIVLLSAAFLLQMHTLNASADQVKQQTSPVQSVAKTNADDATNTEKAINNSKTESSTVSESVQKNDVQDSQKENTAKNNIKTDQEVNKTDTTEENTTSQKENAVESNHDAGVKNDTTPTNNSMNSKQIIANKNDEVSKTSSNINLSKAAENKATNNTVNNNSRKTLNIDKNVPFKHALLKNKVQEYKNSSLSSVVVKIGQIGDVISLQGIVVDGTRKYYLLTNNTYILVDNCVLQKLNNNYTHYYVHANYTHLIKAKKGFVLYSDANTKKGVRTVHKGEYVAVSGIYYTASGMPKLRFGDLYFTANRSFVETSKLPFKKSLLKSSQNEYQKASSNSVLRKKGKKGDVLSLKGLYLGDNNVYIKVTYNYYIVADFNNLQRLTTNYQRYYVHKNYTGKIKVKKGLILYSDLKTKHQIDVIRKGSFIKITGMQYTSTGIPKLMMGNYYLTASRAYVETSTSSKIFLNIKTICQNPEFPTGCEAIATTMMLQGAGVNISKQQVVNEMPRTNTHDGNLGFIGNPRSQTGWWIYPPAMLKVVKNHLSSGANLTNCSFNDIKKKINIGHTVVVWISGYGGPMTKINHAITITGYDNSRAYFNDPWTGKQLSMTIKQLHNYRKADAYRALGY